MADKPFKPFVPASSDMAELSIKALVLGVIMARGSKILGSKVLRYSVQGSEDR